MKPVLPALLLAVTLLGACGAEGANEAEAEQAESTAEAVTDPASESPSGTAEPSATPVKPANGKTYRLDGLTVTVPKGWSDVGEQPSDDTVLAVMHTGVDDTPERLAVRRVSTQSPRAAVAAEARLDLKSVGAVKVKDKGTVAVAGQKAAYSTAIRDRGGVYQRYHQYVVTDDDVTWVLTFSVNRWQQRPDPQRVIDSILTTVKVG